MKTVLILLATAAFVQLSQQDSCHVRELDSCVGTVVRSLRENPVPQNEEQLEQQCKVGKESHECIKNYTDKCATRLQRELLSFVTEGGRASFNEYCTPGSDLRKSILERSECLTKAWEEQRSCMSDAQAGIESLTDAPVDKRLDVLCCTYHRYRTCGAAIARKNCGDDVEEWLTKIAGLVVSNLPNIVCNSCENNDAVCRNLLPTPGTKPKGSASDSAVGQLLGLYFNN